MFFLRIRWSGYESILNKPFYWIYDEEKELKACVMNWKEFIESLIH